MGNSAECLTGREAWRSRQQLHKSWSSYKTLDVKLNKIPADSCSKWLERFFAQPTQASEESAQECGANGWNTRGFHNDQPRRLALTPSSPNKPLPNNHTAAGNGTAAGATPTSPSLTAHARKPLPLEVTVCQPICIPK